MSQPTDLHDVFNLGCPACGHADELARVTPEGSEPEGDHEWDEASYCRCPACDHDGTVADFTQTISDAEKAALAKLNGETQ